MILRSGQWSRGKIHGTGTYIWTGGYTDHSLSGMHPHPQSAHAKVKNHSVRGKLAATHRCRNNTMDHSLNGTFSLIRGYNVYEGEWRRGQRHGEGLLQSASGIKFRGTWVRNKKQGLGILMRANGTVVSRVSCLYFSPLSLFFFLIHLFINSKQPQTRLFAAEFFFAVPGFQFGFSKKI